MSIISPICGTKRSNPCWKGYEMIGMKRKGKRVVPNCVPKKGIGAISITKSQKYELIETYYDFKNMKYSEVASQQNTLKPFASRPNLFDAYKKELLRLIDKNDAYIKQSLKAEKYILNKKEIKI